MNLFFPLYIKILCRGSFFIFQVGVANFKDFFMFCDEYDTATMSTSVVLVVDDIIGMLNIWKKEEEEEYEQKRKRKKRQTQFEDNEDERKK